MRNAALQRPVALLAAVVIAGMAIGGAYHHHGALVLDATPDRPSLVGVSDEGPSACALCAGATARVENVLVPAPAPAPVVVGPRLPSVPVDEVVALASASPRSPPAPAAPAV